MMFRWFAVTALFLVWFFPETIPAQDKLVLLLENSLDYALQNNPEFKIAEKEVQKARAGVWQAYSSILPQLDGSVNFQHNWKIQESRIPNFIKAMLSGLPPPFSEMVAQMDDYVLISFGLENTLIYGARVNQPLFLGGAGLAGIQAAAAARDATLQVYEAKKQTLIYQTASTFYTCLLTRELIAVQEEAQAEAEANLELVNKKYNVGMASGFDRMRAQVDVANSQPVLIAAKNNYRMAMTHLRTILGLAKDAEIEVEGEFTYIEDDLQNFTLLELQEMATRNRPEMLALQQQRIISQKQVVIARSEFLPKVFFTSDYSFMAMKNDMNFKRDDFRKGFYSAVSLQIPLFHGFRSMKGYQKAQLDNKIFFDTEKQAVDGINAEVEVAYNNFLEGKEKFLSARETVEMARESLRLANLMYEEGANTQLDVMSAQLALTRARLNYASSLYDYQIARYQLYKAVGKLHGVI
jgi:outer membrane protein